MPQTEQVSKQLLTDSNWINKIQNVMQENVMSLFEKFYNGAHDLVYSTASTTIIMLIVVYWLIRQIKTGYPTYDEIWKAGKYVLIVCGIFAVLTSFGVYTEFLHLLMIPENIITSVVSSIFQSQDFASIVTESANRVDNIRSLMWNYGVDWTLKSSQSSFLGSWIFWSFVVLLRSLLLCSLFGSTGLDCSLSCPFGTTVILSAPFHCFILNQ